MTPSIEIEKWFTFEEFKKVCISKIQELWIISDWEICTLCQVVCRCWKIFKINKEKDFTNTICECWKIILKIN